MARTAVAEAASRAIDPGAATGGEKTTRLHVVAQPAPVRSNLPFVVVCTVILVGALLGVLALNISISGGSFRLQSLQSQSTQLSEKQQKLRQEVAVLDSPQALAQKAEMLGMVQAPDSAFVQLPSGRILGKPQPAVKPSKGEQKTIPMPDLSRANAVPTTRPSAAEHGMGRRG